MDEAYDAINLKKNSGTKLRETEAEIKVREEINVSTRIESTNVSKSWISFFLFF